MRKQSGPIRTGRRRRLKTKVDGRERRRRSHCRSSDQHKIDRDKHCRWDFPAVLALGRVVRSEGSDFAWEFKQGMGWIWDQAFSRNFERLHVAVAHLLANRHRIGTSSYLVWISREIDKTRTDWFGLISGICTWSIFWASFHRQLCTLGLLFITLYFEKYKVKLYITIFF